MIIVDTCMICFHFDCIMQLKKSYHIATNVCGRKCATTFGDLPDTLSRRNSPASLRIGFSRLQHPVFHVSFGWRDGRVRADEWRNLGDFLFCLEFCQVDSMFGEAFGLLIFLLDTTFLPGFPASLLFIDCTIDSHIPPPDFFSPPVFLGRPTHIFSCLQQTGLQLFPDLFCPTTTNMAWGRLRDEIWVLPSLLWSLMSWKNVSVNNEVY